MITESDNQRLTSVAAGTPSGELLRRYWYPIATAGEMRDRWTKRVRLLGEDLVLFRDRSGTLRPDRRVLPASPRLARLRHPDAGRHPLPLSRLEVRRHAARALDQPNEPEGSTFKDKVSDRRLSGRSELGGIDLGATSARSRRRCCRARRLRRRARDSHDRLGAWSRATGCRSWRTRSIRCTPNGCTATCKSSSRSSATGSSRLRDLAPSRQDRLRRVRIRHLQAPAATKASRKTPTIGASAIRSSSRTCSRSAAAATALAARTRSRSACRSTTRTTHALLVHRLRSAARRRRAAAPARRRRRSSKCRARRRRRLPARNASTRKTSWRGSRKARSPSANSRSSGRPIAASSCSARCSSARSSASPRATIRWASSASPNANTIIDLHTEYDKGMFSDGIANRMSRTQARYSPYFADLVELLTAAQTRARAQRPLATAH